MKFPHYPVLMRDACSVRGLSNRTAINHLIALGVVNANDTVMVEKAATPDDWHRLFEGTIGTMLASDVYPAAVVSFFTSRGLRY